MILKAMFKIVSVSKLSLICFPKCSFSILTSQSFTFLFCSFVFLLLFSSIPSSLKSFSARRCIATLIHGRRSPSREGMASHMLISKSFYRNPHVSLCFSPFCVHSVSSTPFPSQPRMHFKLNEKLSLTKQFPLLEQFS